MHRARRFVPAALRVRLTRAARCFSSAPARQAAADARSTPTRISSVPPPTLLHSRHAVAAPAAPSSSPVRSLAHLLSLDPSARSRPLELTFLGTASGRASVARNTTSVALRLGAGSQQRMALFDCGEGTARQIAHCSHLRLSSLSHVFLTHMHGDHLWGLCALLSQSSRARKVHASPLPDPLAPDAVSRTLHVFGPQGIAEYVKFNLRASHTWLARPLLFHELLRNNVPASSLQAQPDVVYHQSADVTRLSMQVYEDDAMRVFAAPLKHRDLNCWGYVVEEKIASAGSARGSSAAPRARGRRVAVLGDTCDSSALLDVAQGVDALVHEATYLDAETERGLPFLKGHSSARMAGEFARACDAHHLLLTHFSQRHVSDTIVREEDTRPHVQQASEGAGHKRVHAVQDFQVFHIQSAP